MLEKVSIFLDFLFKKRRKPLEKTRLDLKPGGKELKQNADFDNYLRHLLGTREKLSAGKLQIISLDKVKAMVEGDWDQFSGKIRETVNNTVMKRLGPKDSFIQTGDGTYIIIFERLSKEDAELECVLIVQEVLHTLFADRHMDDSVDIRTVAIDIDGRVNVEEVDLLNVITRLLRDEESAAAKGQKARSAYTSDSDKKDPAKDGFDFDAATGQLPDSLGFKYGPIWDVKRKVLSSYRCIVTDGRSDGYALLGREPDPMLIPALDFLAIGRVTHELRRLYEKKNRLVLFCPVHINTLADSKVWLTYKMLCERVSVDNLKRDLIFEIFGVPPSMENSKITYCIDKIKPYCRSITIRTSLDNVDFGKLDSGSFDSVCADARSFEGSEKRQMKFMDDYVANAHKLKLNAYIDGLSTLSQTTAAIASGFQRISGDAVHSTIEKPEFVFRFEAKNLLGRLAA